MKTVNSLVVILVLTVGALFFANANQSAAGQPGYSRSNDGVLRMKHSPVLGINVPIFVSIDRGREQSFAKGHVYERYLSPGRHTLEASRPGLLNISFYGTLDVRPGETYSFVVKVTPNQVVLLPVTGFE